MGEPSAVIVYSVRLASLATLNITGLLIRDETSELEAESVSLGLRRAGHHVGRASNYRL